MRKILLPLLLVLTSASFSQSKKTENVILITLDGMRWQDVFTGADLSLINNKEFVEDSAGVKSRFWVSDVNERRKLLMPFLWNEVGSKGQLYGNRTKNNFVNVTNKMWFSYPGYNEILTGAADDVRINSNDKNPNPNVTVLEVVNQQPSFKNRVAAFTSWDVFPEIINTKRSGVLVNSGIDEFKDSPLNDKQVLLNNLIHELPYLGYTRPDAITFHLGFEYLKKKMPSVLYLSFDETDHFAHEGMYDLYLQSVHYTDALIAELWSWIQSEPKYKDKTTMILTTDHGRGTTKYDSWRHHGAKEPNADQIWVAVIGPDTPATGERKSGEQFYQNQIAATLASLMNIKFETQNSGKPISPVSSK
ncbi:MAG TPA: phosphoglyceromutase [Cytophagales bacterium]|nr:phosphoglyceromutase [Cytophagales bacterium]